MLTKFRNHIIKMTGFITQVASVRLTNFQNSYCTKMKFFNKDSFQLMWQSLQETTNLITYTKEILNGKPHFLSSAWNLSFHNFCSTRDIHRKLPPAIAHYKVSWRTNFVGLAWLLTLQSWKDLIFRWYFRSQRLSQNLKFSFSFHHHVEHLTIKHFINFYENWTS